ncbi:MAG: class I SAM-dependent methyltransferase [Planctomycetales bacterium]
MSDSRRKYYDHEPAYRRIAANGGRGWDDREGADQVENPFSELDAFLKSEWCPAAAEGSRALDLGCGGGEGTLRLALCGYRAWGVDYSETAIELAKRNAAEVGVEACFLVDDCTALEKLTEGPFDLIIDHHVMHCLITPEDRAACLAGVARLLTPGGRFFSSSMSAHGEIDMERLQIDPVTRRDRRNTRYWVLPEEFRAELERAGLRTLDQKMKREADSIPSGDVMITVACRADSLSGRRRA